MIREYVLVKSFRGLQRLLKPSFSLIDPGLIPLPDPGETILCDLLFISRIVEMHQDPIDVAYDSLSLPAFRCGESEDLINRPRATTIIIILDWESSSEKLFT